MKQKCYPAKKKRVPKIIIEITPTAGRNKILLCDADGNIIKEFDSMLEVTRTDFMKGINYTTFRNKLLDYGFYWINDKHTAKLIYKESRIRARWKT